MIYPSQLPDKAGVGVGAGTEVDQDKLTRTDLRITQIRFNRFEMITIRKSTLQRSNTSKKGGEEGRPCT